MTTKLPTILFKATETRTLFSKTSTYLSELKHTLLVNGSIDRAGKVKLYPKGIFFRVQILIDDDDDNEHQVHPIHTSKS